MGFPERRVREDEPWGDSGLDFGMVQIEGQALNSDKGVPTKRRLRLIVDAYQEGRRPKLEISADDVIKRLEEIFHSERLEDVEGYRRELEYERDSYNRNRNHEEAVSKMDEIVQRGKAVILDGARGGTLTAIVIGATAVLGAGVYWKIHPTKKKHK
ncbi:MAG: hypothetical protein Q7S45_05275 [Candidatus Curtissbacteria bacterium]|nr:hypothetical protein [Candidatus Curtissbacteria bacterium]